MPALIFQSLKKSLADSNNCFYGRASFRTSDATRVSLTLTRPVAQVNLYTDDIIDHTDAASSYKDIITDSYGSDANVFVAMTWPQFYKTLDLKTGTVGTSINYSSPYKVKWENCVNDVTTYNSKKYNLLYSDFIFVPSGNELNTSPTVAFARYDESGKELVGMRQLPSVPMRFYANAQTNLLGSMLTVGTSFTVTIDSAINEYPSYSFTVTVDPTMDEDPSYGGTITIDPSMGDDPSYGGTITIDPSMGDDPSYGGTITIDPSMD